MFYFGQIFFFKNMQNINIWIFFYKKKNIQILNFLRKKGVTAKMHGYIFFLSPYNLASEQQILQIFVSISPPPMISQESDGNKLEMYIRSLLLSVYFDLS